MTRNDSYVEYSMLRMGSITKQGSGQKLSLEDWSQD